MSTSDVQEPQISPLFNYEIVYIKVEDLVFCVPRNHFVATSEVFTNTFLRPQNKERENGEGESKFNPIVLPDQFKKEDFTSLLKVMYPTANQLLFQAASAQPLLGLSKDEMIGVLKLSTIWEMDKIRDYAIHVLSNDHDLQPTEKVFLARTHKVARWFEEGVASLIEKKGELASLSALGTLGWFTAAQIYSLREIKQINQYGFFLDSLLCHCNRTKIFDEADIPLRCSACDKAIGLIDIVYSDGSLTAAGECYIPFNSSRCPRCAGNPFVGVSKDCSHPTCGAIEGSSAGVVHVTGVDARPMYDMKAKIKEVFGDEIEGCRYQSSSVASEPGMNPNHV